MLILTNSRIGSYLTCPRRHWWSYELGIRREQDSGALSIGKAFHASLEALNLGKSIEEATAIIRAEPMPELDREIVACMVAGWQWRWSESPMFRKVIAVEQVFEYKPVKSARWSVAGKIDVIGELHDGRVAVGEYKTTSEGVEPGSDYWRRLLIDRQVSMYIHGARSLGFPADTVIYDAARKPGMRPRLLSRKSEERENMEQYAARLIADMGERPDWYFGRQEIARLDADLAESEREMAHFADLIRNSRSKDRWPRNTDACRRFGTCPYFGPCADSFNPETQGTPSGFKRVEDVNVELLVGGEPQTGSEDDNSTSAA